MTSLKKYPLFLICLPVFFCLHGWLENYGFIEGGEILMVGAGILIFVLLLFGLLFLLTKRNMAVAALVTVFIGCWYLFFGAIVDELRSIHFYFFSSYSFLLPACLAATLLLKIVLKRKQHFRGKLFYYCNILLLIYCLVDGGRLIAEASSPHKKITRASPAFNLQNVKSKPNVYYLLFDEYAGYKSLQDSFHYRNDALNDYLSGKGFKMLPYFANYDFTIFSMASILNMNYVPEDYSAMEIEQKALQRRITEIRNGSVLDVFKQMGYRIHNYSIFDINDQHSISTQNELLPVHSILITDKILHNRIMRTSGFLFQTGKWAIPSLRKKYLFETDNNNLRSEELILKTAGNPGSQPGFSYAHFLMPHWPFYRDSLSNYVNDSIIAQPALMGNKPLYISYVKYTNRVIRQMVDTITAKDPGAIILIMSDHGFRSYNDRFTQPYVFDNFVALKLPSGLYPDAATGRSNVNVFRYVFNAGFNQQMPYLPDSSIVLEYKQ